MFMDNFNHITPIYGTSLQQILKYPHIYIIIYIYIIFQYKDHVLQFTPSKIINRKRGMFNPIWKWEVLLVL